MERREGEDLSLPLNSGAIEWVTNRQGRPLTVAECEMVTILSAAFQTGPWNIRYPRKWNNQPGEARIAYHAAPWTLATLSEPGEKSEILTRLVFAAHARRVSLSVVPSAPGCVGIRVVPIPRREPQPDLGCWSHVRTLDEAVKVWDTLPRVRPGSG